MRFMWAPDELLLATVVFQCAADRVLVSAEEHHGQGNLHVHMHLKGMLIDSEATVSVP